jgi:hypothetical protein
MKKTSALLGAIAALAMAGVPQSAPSQSVVQKNHDAVIQSPRTVRQRKATSLNPTGGYELEIFEPKGRSPKEYGQYLQ